jgi:DNA-binding transcriptional ArsR family regulator
VVDTPRSLAQFLESIKNPEGGQQTFRRHFTTLVNQQGGEVSKPLKVLERAGLITRGREAQWRPCRLRAEPLADVAEWVAPYRQYRQGSSDRLADPLRTVRKDA